MFDLAAQNTGNIFKYKHNIKTDEYIQIENPLLFTSKVENIEVPNEILTEIFNIARENKELMHLEKN